MNLAAAARPWEDWADLHSERLNAILLRETRRALNGRFFVTAFLILLGLCVLASLTTLVSGARDPDTGWQVFMYLFLALCAVSFVGLPLMISMLVHAEIQERTLELVSITRLTAARIVWGELLTAAGMFVLMASAVAPFMVFSYLLGGLDLRTIFSGIAAAFLGAMLLTLISLVGAVQRTAALGVRILAVLLAVVCLFFAAGFTNPWSRPLEAMWDDDTWPYVLGVGLPFYLSVAAIFFAMAVGRLTFAAANRSAPLRTAVALHLLTAGALSLLEPAPWLYDVWPIYSAAVLYLLGILSVGEEEALSRRQRRAGPVAWRLQTFWSFFLPGARRGMAFVFALQALVALAATVHRVLLDERLPFPPSSSVAAWAFARHEGILFVPALSFAYLVLFLSIPYALGLPFRGPLARRILVLAFFLATLVVPPIALLTLQAGWTHAAGWACINPLYFFPVVLADSHRALPAALVLLALGAVALAAASLPLLRALREGRRELVPAKAERPA